MDHSLKDAKPINYTVVSDGNKKMTGYQQSYKTEFTEAACPREDKTYHMALSTVNNPCLSSSSIFSSFFLHE